MANYESIASAADSLTCAKPSGTVEGDVLVAFTFASGTGSLAGWAEVEVSPAFGGVFNLTALTKAAGPSEPSSYTFSASGSVGGSAILRVSGANTVTPVDGTPTINGTASLALTCGAITTTTTNALLIMATISGTSAGATVDPSMVDRLQASMGGGSLGLTIGTEDRPLPGNAGSRTFTRGANPQVVAGLMFAIGSPPPPVPVPLPDNSATYRAPTSVLISDPAGFNQQRVPVNAVPRSWVVGGSGALSAEIMSRDLVRFGLNDELRGHEIVVHDDDAGTWGGIITDAQPNGDGTTEIAATSWEASFDKKRLPRRSRALFGPAGTLALNAITESTRETGTAIVDRTATDFGVPVTLNYDGGDLLAALDSMAAETGQEWWVDADTKAFRWGVKGRDLTGSVHLIAGRHIVNWRMPTSIEPVINDLQAFPTNDDYAVWQTVRVTNPASIAAVGIRQGSAAIPGGTHAVHIRGRAQGLVNELAALGQAIEFDLANVDRCFRWFREGDQICVTVPSISVQVTCRVMARALNEDGTMSVSADVLTRRDV